MKHFINAQPNSDEFRQKFTAIRNTFLLKMQEAASVLPNCEFRACDIAGEPVAWVWDNDVFKNTGKVGSLADAKNFAGHMIDQGMQFAFATCLQDDRSTVWLTTWEEPEVGLNWPSGIEVLESEIHEGVCIDWRPVA